MIRPRRTWFRHDPEHGGVLVFWALGIAVFLGLIALSFDIGRLANTQTELQTFVDEVAIAAAGELDRLPGARARALVAADDLIVDKVQTFGSGDQQLNRGRALSDAECNDLIDAGGDPADCAGDFTVDFLDGAGGIATTDAQARQVRVTALPERVQMPFARAVSVLTGGGGPEFADATASATAGNSLYVCAPVRFGFCINPANFSVDAYKGRQIEISDFGSGNTGLLDMASMYPDAIGPCAGINLNSVDYDVCMYGAEGTTASCFVLDGVDTEPGTKGGNFLAAINTRFDIYSGNTQNNDNDEEYRPAPNVVRQCTPTNQQLKKNKDMKAAVSLPRDASFSNGIGSGLATGAIDGYLAANYDDPDERTAIKALMPADPTRWDVYQAEIEHAAGGDILTDRCISGVPENSDPHGNTSNVSDDGKWRRVMVGAAIDCGSGTSINGRTQDVPIADFVYLFLTEPANGGNDPIYAEVIDEAPDYVTSDPSIDSIAYRVVRLVR